MNAVHNVLTVDVEDWYHLNYDSMTEHRGAAFESRVEANTDRLLQIFESHRARATFFFLGSVAESHPQLVRRAQAAGHEIASHGHAHELVHTQTAAEFRADVQRSVAALADVTGNRVRGYRAPSWSVSERTPWFYDVLAGLDLDYSSSLFPFRTYLYGDGEAPTSWFVRETANGRIVEMPASVAEVWGRRIPFAGGVYFRALPLSAIRWATRRVNRAGRAAVYYLHPREIDPAQPRLSLPLVDRMVTYWGLRGTAGKLSRLLSRTTTVGMAEHLRAVGALPASDSLVGVR